MKGKISKVIDRFEDLYAEARAASESGLELDMTPFERHIEYVHKTLETLEGLNNYFDTLLEKTRGNGKDL